MEMNIKSFLAVINFIFILFISLTFDLYADSKILTLRFDECINIARESSPRAVAARKNYESSSASHRGFNAGLLPQFNLDLQAPGLNRSITQITQPDGALLFKSQSQLYSSGDLTLSQKLPLTGTELYISSGLSRIDVFGSNEYFLWRSTPISISVIQPLFSHNTIKWDSKLNEYEYRSASRRFSEAMEEIAIEASEKFFDVFIAKMNLQNAEFNLAVNDTLYTLSRGRYNVGKIAENDLLQSELALTNERNRYEASKLDLMRAVEELAIYLGISEIEDINVIPPDNPPIFEIDINKAIEEAKQNSSQWIGYDIEQFRADRNLSMAESRNGFNASISAGFGLNQSAGNLDEAYKELLDQERFNISFNIPIFNWGKNDAEVEEASLRKESTEIDIRQNRKSFEISVKYQALRIIQLQKQLATSMKSDTIAVRRFEVAKNRYLIGKIDLNSFFIAQNEKNSALAAYIQTLKSYWSEYFRLRKMTLYDFIANRKLFQEIN